MDLPQITLVTVKSQDLNSGWRLIGHEIFILQVTAEVISH